MHYICTWGPELDNHKDHKVSSWALFEALKLENMTDMELLLYSNHQYHCSGVFPFGKQWTGTTIAPLLEEDSIRVRSMVSFPLNRKKQSDKLFVLESMHALRPGNDWMTLKGTTKMFAKKTVKSIYGYEPNYYRRAVRSNELFYVAKLEDLQDY